MKKEEEEEKEGGGLSFGGKGVPVREWLVCVLAGRCILVPPHPEGGRLFAITSTIATESTFQLPNWKNSQNGYLPEFHELVV